jgi:hypothetical protein
MNMNKLQFCLLVLIFSPFYISAQSTHYDPMKIVEPQLSPDAGATHSGTDPLRTYNEELRYNGEEEINQAKEGLEYTKSYDAAETFIDEVQIPHASSADSSMPAPLAKSQHIRIDTLATLPGREPLPNE